jgi:hypothetical protein
MEMNTMRRRLAVLALALIVLVAGCQAAQPADPTPSAPSAAPPPTPILAQSAPALQTDDQGRSYQVARELIPAPDSIDVIDFATGQTIPLTPDSPHYQTLLALTRERVVSSGIIQTGYATAWEGPTWTREHCAQAGLRALQFHYDTPRQFDQPIFRGLRGALLADVLFFPLVTAEDAELTTLKESTFILIDQNVEILVQWDGLSSAEATLAYIQAEIAP